MLERLVDCEPLLRIKRLFEGVEGAPWEHEEGWEKSEVSYHAHRSEIANGR